MGHRKVKCPFSIAMLVYQSVSNTDFGFFFGPYGPSSVVWFIPSEKGDQTKKIITGKNNPHVLPNKKNEKCFFFQTLMTFHYSDWLIGILITGLLKRHPINTT